MTHRLTGGQSPLTDGPVVVRLWYTRYYSNTRLIGTRFLEAHVAASHWWIQLAVTRLSVRENSRRMKNDRVNYELDAKQGLVGNLKSSCMDLVSVKTAITPMETKMAIDNDEDRLATSTTEAEYVAAASCCGQVLWIQNQMLDYGFNFMNTKIHIDNESTTLHVKNPVYHSKTKHIEIRHHFIRDSYEKKLIRVEKIHTDFNVADLLTKAFDRPRYALTHNPTIHDSLVKQFWQTATASTLADGTLESKSNLVLEYTFTVASVRRGVPRPLLPAMLPVVAQNAGQADQARTQSQPLSSTVPPPPTSQPAPTESTTIPPTPATDTYILNLHHLLLQLHLEKPWSYPFEQPSTEPPTTIFT
ncbi:hypothetical protein Tco_0694172 [Tanacetum coccineum]